MRQAGGLELPDVMRTLGPLHLEDLEPHRFEDLVRQLLYDFRPWRELEATGRSGADGGFDARGWEGELSAPILDSEEVSDEGTDPAQQRQWLIQCKREKAIGPKKLTDYLDALPDARGTGIYGLIFVAACDFSITARDDFRERSRALGFQEARLWGRAELEDALFQPKNDHLLFAYFGISLQIRKRSARTAIRSRLAAKRKAKRALDGSNYCLILDGTDERYPALDENDMLPRAQRGRWSIWEFSRHSAYGMLFRSRRHFAFVDDDQVHWDYAETMNDAVPHEDPWRTQPRRDDNWQARTEAMVRWDALEPRNRAWVEVLVILPYDALVDIDADGDDFFRGPILYVDNFGPDGKPPFAPGVIVDLSVGAGAHQIDANLDTRVEIFERAVSDEDGPEADR